MLAGSNEGLLHKQSSYGAAFTAAWASNSTNAHADLLLLSN
ncbi:hypothetical protein HMPREF3213_02999 [Heyndrickxia coagulans]|uniref:Uncharacterized protein n=1 Tax=Heyndrickxia coagulans TaxID=1398 RepID=A0A133KFM0_HEYCO|nr:hypothetical protein HMPREF3213_02999 [Heyndrickxia coagulans]